MKPIIFSLYGSKKIAEELIQQLNYERGMIEIRRFPDEEVYVKLGCEVSERKVFFIATLDRIDNKLLPLIFAADTVRELGAKEVGLIAPYLSYMRQDKRFKEGEGITSKYFGKLLSSYFDWMITIDPHLHRWDSMDEIYSIPVDVLHAVEPISNWIKMNVKDPLIIGPDRESLQWVFEIAGNIRAPFIILEKTRKGDKQVEIVIPEIKKYKNCTPILLDDIISTGKTMIEVITQLKILEMKPPICIGVHAVFTEGAYAELLQSGVLKVVTSNTIEHPSNQLDITGTIIKSLKFNFL